MRGYMIGEGQFIGQQRRLLLLLLLFKKEKREMKLLMGDEVFVPEDQVIIRLIRRGNDIELTMQKRGNVEQTVLQFFSNGTVRKAATFTDIGFKTGGDGRIVISG